MERERLDTAMVKRGIVHSRVRARERITQEGVLVDGVVMHKPAAPVSPDNVIELLGKDIQWVSRAGIKLDAALNEWNIDVTDMVCLDVGASTGGFTDALLAHGARCVYAVDVGTDQLAEQLQENERVISLEQSDIRSVSKEHIPEAVDIATIDTSFISLTQVLPAVTPFVKSGGDIIALIKPQFELGKGGTERGIVTDPTAHREAITRVRDTATTLDLQEQRIMTSPITGGSGNTEFLIWLKKK